jgi:thiamine biosynthesis lipoprotein
VCIDLGGFAKGHAVDRAAACCANVASPTRWSAPAATAVCIGDRRGRPWSVAIRDPRRVGEVVAVLPLEDVSISTSGDYERYFDEDGQRHHHLIDPATGRSARAACTASPSWPPTA